MVKFLETYQTLVGTLFGSFLAIISSVFLWFLKETYEKRKSVKENRKELNSIFFMAARDSEESVGDIVHVIPLMRAGVKKSTSIERLHVFMAPKLNRVFLDEERLATLRKGLDFATEQQVEIAVSSAKKFNSYMEHFESAPSFIFESTLKLVESGLTQKDKVVDEYRRDMEKHLNDFEKMIPTHLETAQRNMLRPIVVQTNKRDLKRFNKMRNGLDEELNALAAIVLSAIKKDLE